jgi:hypothetical protein
VGVQGSAVKRGGSAVCGHRVGDDGVGVELRVAGARRAVAEGRHRQLVALHQMPSIAAAACPGCVPFEVADRVAYRFVVGLSDDR